MKNYYFKERPRKKKKAILWCSCFQKKHIRQKTMLKKRVWWSVRSRQWGKSKCKLSSVILKAKAYSRPSRSQILPYKPFFFFKSRGILVQKPSACVTLHAPDWIYRNSFCEEEKKTSVNSLCYILTKYSGFEWRCIFAGIYRLSVNS